MKLIGSHEHGKVPTVFDQNEFFVERVASRTDRPKLSITSFCVEFSRGKFRGTELLRVESVL